jgi:hypothetical protein
MHLGEKRLAAMKVEYWLSYALIIECATCGKSYDYSDSEDKFRQTELPPPPPRHLDRLAPSPIMNLGAKDK